MPFANGDGAAFVAATIATEAPEASGVYGLFNPQQCIYIGESEDIQRRLQEHFKEKQTCIWRNNPTRFRFELCLSPFRVARQKALILELRPVCNQHLG